MAAPPTGSNPDWPCVQREVPQISPGMVWAAGPVDAGDQSWSSDPLVAPKVAEISSRRKSTEEAVAEIDAFAASLKDDRTRVLTALFVGVLQRVNYERSQIIAGIKRYARKQGALADAIKDKSKERATLAAKPSRTPEEEKKLADLDEQLTWDDRIYQERRESLRYVCDTPVLLEQRMFQIGRHISQLVSQN
jgi:hypothetical protein